MNEQQSRQNVEEIDRTNKLSEFIIQISSNRQISPEIRARFCFAELCCPKYDQPQLVKRLRTLLGETPFEERCKCLKTTLINICYTNMVQF